ncbi:hypothetical protein C2S53_008416 [Perilla frutescens var. hirtella]|uniref:Uncharacterized protein n=1 Tax=Perilla frutescens var. hirtella TaxID=608512 RepID=A0AAD4ISM5_PERFH|nr:hypothetical protein C2S53_008416 [Perilla frutescens var. hirtella]
MSAAAHKLTPAGTRGVIVHRELPDGIDHVIHYFSAATKTMEFQNCLNLPCCVVDYIGDQSRRLGLLVGFQKVRFPVEYKYRQILDKKMNRLSIITRLEGGWKEVVEYMDLNQGETVELRSCVCDPSNFYVARKLHDGLREVKKEEFEGVFNLDN